MKIFIPMLLLSTSLANAFPAKGDRVEYHAEWDHDPVVMVREVTDQEPVKDLFRVHTQTTYRGSIIQDQWADLPRSFLYTPEKIADVIRHCAEREGAVGNDLVAGQRMQVCEFYNEDSQLTNIIGPVPFGVVRFQTYIGGEDFLDFHIVKFNSVTPSLHR